MLRPGANRGFHFNEWTECVAVSFEGDGLVTHFLSRSTDDREPPLRLFFGLCGRRARKLQDAGALTLAQLGQKQPVSIRKFERVMMHKRQILVDLPKYRRPVTYGSAARPKAGYFDITIKCELGPRQHADGYRGILLRREPARAGAEMLGRKPVANLRGSRSDALKTVVTHLGTPRLEPRNPCNGQSPIKTAECQIKADCRIAYSRHLQRNREHQFRSRSAADFPAGCRHDDRIADR